MIDSNGILIFFNDENLISNQHLKVKFCLLKTYFENFEFEEKDLKV
jgi:plasmid rolling circle replication initiator protein Rep